MGCYVQLLHAAEHHQEDHVGHRAREGLPGKDVFAFTRDFFGSCKDGETARRQRNAMRTHLWLRPLSGDCPHCGLNVEFGPWCFENLGRSGRGQDQEFESQPGGLTRVALAQGSDEPGHLFVRQRGVVNIAVQLFRETFADTLNRVIARAGFSHLGPVQNSAYALTHAARGLRFGQPDGRQRSQHIRRLDLMDGPVPENRKHIGIERIRSTADRAWRSANVLPCSA